MEQKTESSCVPTANPADVASIDAFIIAAYDSISGPAGQKRDWNRERSLFIPGARFIPTSKLADALNPEGEIAPHVLDIDGYLARLELSAGIALKAGGVRQRELLGEIVNLN